VTTFPNNPPPTYHHRCFVMTRSARQFFYHAQFDPTLPVVEPARYRALIREVISRSPRRISAEDRRIVIPGYEGLRAFTRAHQARMARHLLTVFPTRLAPIVHIVRFPQLTMNHGIVLFDCEEKEDAIRFAAYDPNVPDRRSELTYNLERRTFFFPANAYWAGGRVDVIELYRGWFY